MFSSRKLREEYDKLEGALRKLGVDPEAVVVGGVGLRSAPVVAADVDDDDEDDFGDYDEDEYGDVELLGGEGTAEGLPEPPTLDYADDAGDGGGGGGGEHRLHPHAARRGGSGSRHLDILEEVSRPTRRTHAACTCAARLSDAVTRAKTVGLRPCRLLLSLPRRPPPQTLYPKNHSVFVVFLHICSLGQIWLIILPFRHSAKARAGIGTLSFPATTFARRALIYAAVACMFMYVRLLGRQASRLTKLRLSGYLISAAQGRRRRRRRRRRRSPWIARLCVRAASAVAACRRGPLLLPLSRSFH